MAQSDGKFIERMEGKASTINATNDERFFVFVSNEIMS